MDAAVTTVAQARSPLSSGKLFEESPPISPVYHGYHKGIFRPPQTHVHKSWAVFSRSAVVIADIVTLRTILHSNSSLFTLNAVEAPKTHIYYVLFLHRQSHVVVAQAVPSSTPRRFGD